MMSAQRQGGLGHHISGMQLFQASCLRVDGAPSATGQRLLHSVLVLMVVGTGAQVQTTCGKRRTTKAKKNRPVGIFGVISLFHFCRESAAYCLAVDAERCRLCAPAVDCKCCIELATNFHASANGKYFCCCHIRQRHGLRECEVAEYTELECTYKTSS